MILEQLPLTKQMEIVFQQIKDELKYLTSGTVFLQIRNNVIGKFGVRHDPLECRGGVLAAKGQGLSDANLQAFLAMALDSLNHKRKWTHGEIFFEFAVKQNVLYTSVQFESNYNMASLFIHNETRKSLRETV